MNSSQILSIALEPVVTELPKPTSLSAKQGIAYERRVLRTFADDPGFIPNLTLRYKLHGEARERVAILDGLLLDRRMCTLTVIEIKNQLNEMAFTQLEFYMMLVAWWSGLPVSGILVCNEVRGALLSKTPTNVSVVPLSHRALRRLEWGTVGNGLRINPEPAHLALRPGGSLGYNLDSSVRVLRMG